MSTTRHHINRTRRLAAAPRPRRTETVTEPTPLRKRPVKEPVAAESSSHPHSPPGRALVVICVLTLLLGAFAGWAHSRAAAERDVPAARNTALTDVARTSEIKGRTDKAVADLFSYDYAHPEVAREAVSSLLTGRAVTEHKQLLGPVLAQADKSKAVITTTVTESAVERISGDRARVLVFADQSSSTTHGKSGTAYAGAMFAVEWVRQDGRWLVSGIDTFGR
ncbi:hypothetical protein CG723_04905 [Streptomyces sp. CB01635]|uniref:hypothetical protein n=1 Tax=unclassified Streptomyces TaxID=2593676 RepID=UPI000C27DDBB|nr:hypothetical protein [Streptomyces sp. CB01635]PJN12389.1 hypothetical protein CG723_04905 [Streptomyces sp. CB01635]